MAKRFGLSAITSGVTAGLTLRHEDPPVDPPPPRGDVVLRADASKDTYQLILDTFSDGRRSVLDVADAHSFRGSNRHIRTVRGGGPQGQDFFRFFIHPRDGVAPGSTTGRNRNEIKGQNGRSPDAMVFRSGDRGRMRWYCRVASDYTQACASSGTDGAYIHQLHEANHGPVTKITIGRGERLVIRQKNRSGSESTIDVLPTNDWLPLLGKWLYFDQQFNCVSNGTYELSMRRVDTGREIFHVRSTGVDMRYGIFRPKWGVYRPRECSGYNAEDTFDFADFVIDKE